MKSTIPWAKPSSFPQDLDYISSAVRSNWLSDGDWLKRFEAEFAQINNIPFALSTSNGTTALQLALLSLSIGQGDEVLIPNFSFVAPGNMVIACGATPVFVDIDPNHWNLDLSSIERHLSPRTKAVIYVHNYGITGDIARVRDFCKDQKIFLIEDVAEACFSKFAEQRAGTFGDIGCFSFQATKTITTGEGGMVITRNRVLHDRMKQIRSHGMDPAKRYWHTDVGYNFRLTNLQGALGCAQLQNLDWILKTRAELYAKYKGMLGDRPSLRLQENPEKCEPAMWAFAVALPLANETRRDQVRAHLAQDGIETRPGFYPYSRMSLYKEYWPKSQLEISEFISQRIILLPFYPGLEDRQLEFICKRFIQHAM